MLRRQMAGPAWMTVLPQLLSRMCHRNDDVFKFIRSTVGMVIVSGLAAFLLFDRSGASLGRFSMATGDGGLVLTGIVVTVTLQLIGYAVFWAGWWFTRSR